MERKLGKGLSALIPEAPEKPAGVTTISVMSIVPNKNQPRKKFDETKIKELMDSIKEKGIIQPVIVRYAGQGYELIAGERRFRAAKALGFSEIPAIIKNVSDQDSLELSLIENIQREELNAIEEALAYKELQEKFHFSQDNISKAVGKDKSTISNTVRLLALPEIIQKYIMDNLLSTGHAKAILSLSGDREKIKFAKRVVSGQLSVRQIEDLVRKKKEGKPEKKEIKDDNVRTLEEKLQHALGTKVTIMPGKKTGKIEIQYYSNEDLERLIGIIAK